MKSKSILAKFLFVLAPLYLGLVLIGSFTASQLLIRDTTDLLTTRIGGLGARVSLALDVHEAHNYRTLANDLIAPLGVDPGVVCVEFRSNIDSTVIATHPPRVGCKGQQDAPFNVELPVDDFYDHSLFIKFTDKNITEAVNKYLLMTAAVLTLAFLVTVISAGISFRMIVSRRLLALHQAIGFAAKNLHRTRVQSDGVDELAQIIDAYNSLIDQDAERERQLTAANEILSLQSKQDPLTGLYNRRFFYSVASDESHTANYANRAGTIMMLDVDFFKNINDKFGHAAGDEVLVELSRRLKSCLPKNSLVVRWGGEEILVYLEDLDPSKVTNTATLLLTVIGSTPMRTKAGAITVSTSIGIVRLPFNSANRPLSLDEAVNIADAALYSAKSSGRNRAISITDLQVSKIEINDLIGRDFETALAQGTIHVDTIIGPPGALPQPLPLDRAA